MWYEYIILIVLDLIAASISGAVGFGGAVLLLPFLTIMYGAQVAIPVLTISQIFGNGARMSIGIKQIKWKEVGLFLMLAIPFSVLLAFGFAVIPKDIATRVIGAVLILLVIIKVISKIELKKWSYN